MSNEPQPTPETFHEATFRLMKQHGFRCAPGASGVGWAVFFPAPNGPGAEVCMIAVSTVEEMLAWLTRTFAPQAEVAAPPAAPPEEVAPKPAPRPRRAK